MNFGSLFSGIGGFDLALERVGMTCSWQVEINNYAIKVLEKNFPSVQRFYDIKECGKHNLLSVDLICGGFPCQPHSVAGKRMASSDERDLWGEFARIIGEIQPRWVLAENVPGLLSSESGRFFGRVLGDLASLGYDAEWDCVPASAVGAPHRRDRVFIVAYSNSQRGRSQSFQRQECENPTQSRNDGESKHVANANSLREPQQKRIFSKQWRWPSNGGWWKVEPDVGRVVDGISARVDRLKCLGNAVVPQIIEAIGRRIIEED